MGIVARYLGVLANCLGVLLNRAPLTTISGVNRLDKGTVAFGGVTDRNFQVFGPGTSVRWQAFVVPEALHPLVASY